MMHRLSINYKVKNAEGFVTTAALTFYKNAAEIMSLKLGRAIWVDVNTSPGDILLESECDDDELNTFPDIMAKALREIVERVQ